MATVEKIYQANIKTPPHVRIIRDSGFIGEILQEQDGEGNYHGRLYVVQKADYSDHERYAAWQIIAAFRHPQDAKDFAQTLLVREK